MHGGMQPREEHGPDWRRWGCGHTQGVLTTWWACLVTAFAWSVPGWAWTLPLVVLGPDCCMKVGFSISLVAHFCFMLCLVFHLYLNVCSAKHVFSNTSGTMSLVKEYVSKDCLFLLFWTLFGGRIRSIVTTNSRLWS
jgi:hypothetical protein